MDANLNMVLDQVSKDKGIEKIVLIKALEEAILAAAKRTFGPERNLTATYNEEKGAVDLAQTIKIVEVIEDGFNELPLKDAGNRGIEAEAGDELVFPIYY